VDLHVRGELPPDLAGSFVVACSRRNKDRFVFSRWHDSQADLIRIDIKPGKPGSARASVLTVDPSGSSFAAKVPAINPSNPPLACSYRHYLTQPNHGLNIEHGTLWATNLLFGFPLEVDLNRWKANRLLQFVECNRGAPCSTGTSHFAWSRDRRYAYFHQSLLTDESPSKAADMRMVRLDTRTGSHRTWRLEPPSRDRDLTAANFHSAFYFEEGGAPRVGLLRTGAVIESLTPHAKPYEHEVLPSPRSTIWIVDIDEQAATLQARLLPGLGRLDAIAMSHLDVDTRCEEGFILYANYKEADVAEETHGVNVYGESAEKVTEHYSGMTVEPLNVGTVIRVEYKDGKSHIQKFCRKYDAGRTSLGHTWLPINIQLDSSGSVVFCTFAGFRPRLLPAHIARAYPNRTADPSSIYYVPPALIRLKAASLAPDLRDPLSHISYAEPMALAVVGSVDSGYACTFSPELGLRVYRAANLSHMLAHVTAHPVWHSGDTHFRPAPAHMEFVPA
jgi:hypothetical protein